MPPKWWGGTKCNICTEVASRSGGSSDGTTNTNCTGHWSTCSISSSRAQGWAFSTVPIYCTSHNWLVRQSKRTGLLVSTCLYPLAASQLIVSSSLGITVLFAFHRQMPGVVFGSSLEAAVRCVHVESGSPVYMGVFNSSSPILSRTLPRPLSARALPLLYSQNELPHSSLSSCSSRLQSHPRRC